MLTKPVPLPCHPPPPTPYPTPLSACHFTCAHQSGYGCVSRCQYPCATRCTCGVRSNGLLPCAMGAGKHHCGKGHVESRRDNCSITIHTGEGAAGSGSVILWSPCAHFASIVSRTASAAAAALLLQPPMLLLLLFAIPFTHPPPHSPHWLMSVRPVKPLVVYPFGHGLQLRCRCMPALWVSTGHSDAAGAPVSSTVNLNPGMFTAD